MHVDVKELRPGEAVLPRMRGKTGRWLPLRAHHSRGVPTCPTNSTPGCPAASRPRPWVSLAAASAVASAVRERGNTSQYACVGGHEQNISIMLQTSTVTYHKM